jgi:hypothetical protein
MNCGQRFRACGAIADRAFAVAARTDEEGPRRGIERVGIRAADLIIAISELSH